MAVIPKNTDAREQVKNREMDKLESPGLKSEFSWKFEFWGNLKDLFWGMMLGSRPCSPAIFSMQIFVISMVYYGLLLMVYTYSNAILFGAYLVIMLLKFSSAPVCLKKINCYQQVKSTIKLQLFRKNSRHAP